MYPTLKAHIFFYQTCYSTSSMHSTNLWLSSHAKQTKVLQQSDILNSLHSIENFENGIFLKWVKFIVRITLVFIFSSSLDHRRRWLLVHLLRVFWGRRHINLESKVKTRQRYESKLKFWFPQKTSRHLCISFSTYFMI